MTVRYNEDLDPNEGPGFGCFIWQATLFAIILLLIPVGLFSFNWPVWLLATLLGIDLVLLFFLSMTAVFLLRVFFADRRGRGRRTGVTRERRIISSSANDAEAPPALDSYEGPLGEASMNFDAAWVPPFLQRVAARVDGFGDEDISRVTDAMAAMSSNDETRIEFSLSYAERIVPLRFEIFMDDEDSPDIAVFTHPELSKTLQEEMQNLGDEMESQTAAHE